MTEYFCYCWRDAIDDPPKDPKWWGFLREKSTGRMYLGQVLPAGSKVGMEWMEWMDVTDIPATATDRQWFQALRRIAHRVDERHSQTWSDPGLCTDADVWAEVQKIIKEEIGPSTPSVVKESLTTETEGPHA